MNWFLYIGGGMLGWLFLYKHADGYWQFGLIAWTLTWIWICWKFIH